MMTILYIIAAILCFFLVFPFITVIFSLFTSDTIRKKLKGKTLKQYDYANVITAYRNAEIAKPLAIAPHADA
jgi:ABC-type spermidine/putrescine transport system permease subunit II